MPDKSLNPKMKAIFTDIQVYTSNMLLFCVIRVCVYVYYVEKVWRVARYTSAAPLYFTAKDGYLDGGLLSDNPAEDALTAIQQFYRKRRLQLPISLVVSIGSGVNPVEPRKCVNITTELWNLPSQLFPFMKILGEAVRLPRTYVPCLHSI